MGRFQVAPGLRQQERPSSYQPETQDPSLQIDSGTGAAQPQPIGTDPSKPAPQPIGTAAPTDPKPQPIGTDPVQQGSAQPLPTGGATPGPAAPPAAPAPVPFPSQDAQANIQQRLGWRDAATQADTGKPAPPFQFALNPPTPQAAPVGQQLQTAPDATPASNTPTPTPAAAGGPQAGTAPADMIRRFNLKADEMGKTQQEFDDSSQRLKTLGTEKATPMPVSGMRRFAGIASGILTGIKEHDPMAGIKEYQDITRAPETRRNQLLDYQTASEQQQNTALKDKLSAQKDVMGAYEQSARDQIELQKFNAPEVHFGVDAATGVTTKYTTDRLTGKTLSAEKVAGDEHSKQIQVKDPNIIKIHPDLKDQWVPDQTFRDLLAESRVPQNQNIKPVLNGKVPVGATKNGQFFAKDDPNMPPDVKAVLDSEESSYQRGLADTQAQKIAFETSLQGMIQQRQMKMQQLEADLKNHQADPGFKNRLASAYMDLDQIKNIREIVKQKPQLIGPVAGRLEKYGQALGTTFGLQNPQDEQDAARLEGYIAYLFANELKAAVSGRPNRDLQADLQKASAQITQDPRMMEGFLRSAEVNANEVIGFGKSKYHIDLDAPRMIDQPNFGQGGQNRFTPPAQPSPQGAPQGGGHPLDKFWKKP